MNDDEGSLSQALSSLSQVADIVNDDEFAEVARVRKARADVTEHARQSGDTAGMLLSGLIRESNAEIEAEKAEKARKLREAEERGRAEAEAAENKRRQEAQEKLDEEKRKFEEKEQIRLQKLAELEKKRKQELGIVDEEEEARKRAEEEAKAARIAAQKAREAAEEAALKSSNEELADQIRLMKEQKAAEAAAEAEAKSKRKMINIIIASALVIIVVAVAGVFISNIKGNDFYRLDSEYSVSRITLEPVMADGFSDKEYARNTVIQSAPVRKGKHNKNTTTKPSGYEVVDLNAGVVK